MRQAFIGMAHRGRLNVMAHVLGKPYEQILAEFKDPGPQRARDRRRAVERRRQVPPRRVAHGRGRRGRRSRRLDAAESEPSRGDRSGARRHGARRRHGRAAGPARRMFNPDAVLPILIHGDAAFPGQGVVAETLNLHRLHGYTTGGTIHIIANNQIGFTTDPDDSYSTLYASGLARGFKIPIVHVNADDPEACIAAARLAFAYREQFKRDFLIDLVGYRRYGHNEGDEPAFTQPVMYREGRRAADRPRSSGRRRSRRAARSRPAAPTRCSPRAWTRCRRSSTRSIRRSIYVEADAGDRRAGHGRAHGRRPCRSIGCARSTTRLLVTPRRLHRAPQARARAAIAGGRRSPIRTRRRSTGPLPRSWRFAIDPRGRHADPTHRRGRRARHLQPSSRRALRRERRPPVHAARSRSAGARVVRDPQQPAQRERRRRLRVRLQRPGAGAARDLGSAVRRLHQRRADDARRVRAVGAREVGAGAVARPAAAARLRRAGAGPRERAARSGSCSSPPTSTCASPTARRPRSTSTCCAGRRRCSRPIRCRSSCSRRRACCGIRWSPRGRAIWPRARWQQVIDDRGRAESGPTRSGGWCCAPARSRSIC